MAKLLVETTKNILLFDTITGCLILEDRPSVVEPSNFVFSRVSLGQIKVLANDLPEDASDEDFLSVWKDNENKDLAISAYLSEYGVSTSDETSKYTPKDVATKEEESKIDGNGEEKPRRRGRKPKTG